MDNNKLLTSYCFLASLTENNNDLYKNVFIPVIKRTLSSYNLVLKKQYGTDIDIQNYVRDLYGLNIPLLVIRKLLKSTENQMSRRERGDSGFKTLENGRCFEIQKYAFASLERKYKEGIRNANALQKAFEEYIKEQAIEEDVPSFSDFLTNYKNKISSFFNGKSIENIVFTDQSYIYHINFLEYIEANNSFLFEIAESVYIGSIVASFFESTIDFDAKFLSGEIYYLDTQIVLKALDLQNESETRPIQELLDLIVETGGKIKILNITYEEIGYHIQNTINYYDHDNPINTINEACNRKGKSKAWLIGINGKLEKYIDEELKTTKENIPEDIIKKIMKSSDIKELQKTRRKQANAEHDVIAYLWVRDKRGGVIRTPQKAKIWFLSANKNLLSFNIINGIQGNVPEITLPDTLTSILWLKNPNKLLSKVKKIGFNELLATTMRDEIASKELISEFDQNIKTIDGISNEDYRILLESVAYQSAKSIEKLNQFYYQGQKEKFAVEAYKIIDRERKKRMNIQETIRKTRHDKFSITEENKALQIKIETLISELEASQKDTASIKTELEKLASKVNYQDKYVKRLIIYFLITLLISIGLYLFIKLDLFNWLNYIIGLGGLWTFGNFIINLLRILKITK